jgi:hypothetical protein
MKYGTFGVRWPSHVLPSPDTVSHDEKRVESECGIDHKLFLPKQKATNQGPALITRFFSASLRQTESSQSQRVNYGTRNRNEMYKGSNTLPIGRNFWPHNSKRMETKKKISDQIFSTHIFQPSFSSSIMYCS